MNTDAKNPKQNINKQLRIQLSYSALLHWHLFGQVDCRDFKLTLAPHASTCLRQQTESHPQMSAPNVTSPTALVINSLSCHLALICLLHPLIRPLWDLPKSLLFWFQLTNQAQAENPKAPYPQTLKKACASRPASHRLYSPHVASQGVLCISSRTCK